MNVPRILFVLPTRGLSGGANSVVQETAGFRRMGLDAKIAVDTKYYQDFAKAYEAELSADEVLVEYHDVAELRTAMAACDACIATLCTTVHLIVTTAREIAAAERPQLYYYIQDYEPFFFPPNSPSWDTAVASYGYGTDVIGFAKTDWIAREISRRHAMTVLRVAPSLDHDTFYPDLSRRAGVPRVAAMIRPSTPRRAPRRTARIMSRIKGTFGNDVSCAVFGASAKEIAGAGLAIDPEVEVLGKLTRSEVAAALRECDVLLDLSDYQAFGRTALEAMACGALPIITMYGGAGEFVTDMKNGALCEVRADDAVMQKVFALMDLAPAARERMRVNAMETAGRYHVTSACASILRVLMG